jgi:hypothetical protein
MDRGDVMLKVVQDIYDEGKDVIPSWKLLAHATDALKRGGPEGLKRYYDRCLDLNDPRGQRVKATLELNSRKTLESEHARFLAAYHKNRSMGPIARWYWGLPTPIAYFGPALIIMLVLLTIWLYAQ